MPQVKQSKRSAARPDILLQWTPVKTGIAQLMQSLDDL
jgi:hypothetical protein